MAKHATLSPSGSARWLACPGSVQLIAALPSDEQDKPNLDSDWGTACHEALATCLEENFSPQSMVGKVIPVEHEHYPTYQHTFTQEDAANVGHAYNYVNSRLMEYGAGALVFIEERMDAGQNFRGTVFNSETLEMEERPTPVNNCWGTADVAMVGNGYAEIIDYKNGRGHVNEEGNTQLLLYLLGLLKRLDPATHHVQRARLTIVQPRSREVEAGAAEVVRTWEFPIDDTLADWALRFGNAAREAAKADAARVPGEPQCTWCPARSRCPDVAKSAIAALTQQVQPEPAPEAQEPAPGPQLDGDLVEALVSSPDVLTEAQVARVLEAEPLIRSWLKAVHDHARGFMLKGGKVPGFKLVRGRRDRKWAYGTEGLEDEAALIKKMANWNRIGDDGKSAGKLKRDVYLTTSVISPAQAEKVIKPQVTAKTWANVEKLIQWSEGKPTVVASTDHRPELTFQTSEEAFGQAAAAATNPLPDFLQ